ncbi:MAG: response regulator transcription factor [Deltaproteobacteria bacterium]|nr:response regulator transcription factor [Deltaproteobacteria bacterium]
MRVLVVEDDTKIADFLAKGFREAGFTVDLAADGDEGLVQGLTGVHDVLVVDLMLPGRDGLSLIEELRARRMTAPVLILSAKRSVDDRVRGLQKGGDDYLTKPFSFAELLARVQALVRRSSLQTEPTSLEVGGLQMDLLTREVTRNGQVINLPAKEFALLEHLLRNAGRVVTKTSILEKVYDFSFDPQTNVVDVLVCRLRNKVDREHESKLIHTIRGMGYVLKEG